MSVNERDTAIDCRSGSPLSTLVSSSYILSFTQTWTRFLSHIAATRINAERGDSVFFQVIQHLNRQSLLPYMYRTCIEQLELLLKMPDTAWQSSWHLILTKTKEKVSSLCDCFFYKSICQFQIFVTFTYVIICHLFVLRFIARNRIITRLEICNTQDLREYKGWGGQHF